MFEKKTLLITGGTGSFGNAVLNRFLKTDIGEIRVFSRDEKKQDDMRHEFQSKIPEVAEKIKFYLVATPIGNLGDFSPRGVETLRTVNFIAAEDTRVSVKLLNHFEIKKPMISYYEHNLRQRGLDDIWLDRQLKAHHVKRSQDVFLLTVDEQNQVYLAEKEGRV